MKKIKTFLCVLLILALTVPTAAFAGNDEVIRVSWL